MYPSNIGNMDSFGFSKIYLSTKAKASTKVAVSSTSTVNSWPCCKLLDGILILNIIFLIYIDTPL